MERVRDQTADILRGSQPRTYLIADWLRVQKPPDGILAWLMPVCTTPDVEIIQKCGVDAFLFIRYIRMMLKIFVPTSLVVIPVLTPINRLSGRGGQASALSVLSISNVAPEHTSSRLWIHLALAMLIVSWVCYVIHEEILVYVKTGHKYLNSPEYRRQVSASTLLVANIPEAMLNEENLQATFEIFPGGVKEVMINRKSKEMSSSIAERNQTVKDLEVAEAKMIALCVVSRAKRRVQQGNRTNTESQTHPMSVSVSFDGGKSAAPQARRWRHARTILHHLGVTSPPPSLSARPPKVRPNRLPGEVTSILVNVKRYDYRFLPTAGAHICLF